MGQYFKAALKGSKAKKNWRLYRTWALNCGAKLTEHSYMECWYMMYIKHLLFGHPQYVVWAGDYADNEQGSDDNIYFLGKEMKINSDFLAQAIVEQPRMKYLLNRTKKLYYDYTKAKPRDIGSTIDPLPLFTAEGNGQGGGDYYGENKEKVGEWARDLISIEEELPKGYTEVTNPFYWDY